MKHMALLIAAFLALADPALSQAAPDPATADTIETQGFVWRAPVAEDLSFDDVDTALGSLASGLNLRDVGRLPSEDEGTPVPEASWRLLQIYMFCNPRTAAKMIQYDPALSIWLPCRISLLEDAEGRLWIYTINMDMLLQQAGDMPPDLAAEATQVRDAIRALIVGAATGEI